jgi:hypothetical protein
MAFARLRLPDVIDWPDPLDRAAFHGLTGKIVGLIEPETESDSAGLVLQLLVAFGVHIGRSPHYSVEATTHCGNLFLALVGQSSMARKGTAWAHVRGILTNLDRPPQIVSGLSSGEGLKFAVRDPVEVLELDRLLAREAPRRHRKPPALKLVTKPRKDDVITTVADPGVPDKRLLVVEPEFASVLRGMHRQGSTLSATVREAWETGNLQTLTRSQPIVVTGAHIGIIGHITFDELRSELTGTDIANGFANRFLYICVRRSKELPFGGSVDKAAMNELVCQLSRAADAARIRGVVQFSEAAKALWASKYSSLSAPQPGLLGAITARAAPQCARLALLYTLIDESPKIEIIHLQAAFAVWRYCADSARCIFGDALGDRVADEILRALREASPQGMTRTEISGHFGRNTPADRIGPALTMLMSRGLARREWRMTAGRQAEVWFAAVTKETN